MQSSQDVQLAGFPAISSIYPSSSSQSPNPKLTRIQTQFSDIAPAATMLPYILQQQQLLLSQHLHSSPESAISLTRSQQEYLSQHTQPQAFPHQGQQQNFPVLTPQEQRNILVSIHHMCQDIKDSLKTLHSRVDEIWTEVGLLKERQSVVEEHCTVDNERDGDYEEVEEEEAAAAAAACGMEAEVPCD